MSKLKRYSHFYLFLVIVLITYSLNIQSTQAVSDVTCSIAVFVNGNNVSISGQVTEQGPEQDTGLTEAYVFIDPGTANAYGSGDTYASAVLNLTLPNGNYTAFLQGNGLTNPGAQTSSCDDQRAFTVNVQAAVATVRVSSNQSTGWTISGPSNFSGTGVTGGPYTGTPGTYTISPNPLNCYSLSVSPGYSMSVGTGEDKTFSLNYAYNCSGPPPPPPTCNDPAALNYGGPAPCTYPSGGGGSCTDGATGAIVDGLPSSMTPGQIDAIILRFKNTGTTRWHHGSVYYGKQNSSLGLALTNVVPYNPDAITEGNFPPVHGHIPQIMNPAPSASDTVTWTFNVTAPSTPGSYQFQMGMYYDDVTLGISANKKDSSGNVCGDGPSMFFGNMVSIPFTVQASGTVTVSSNIPTSWYISGSGGGANYCSAASPCAGTSGNYTSAPLGSYTINGIPSNIVYNGNNYSLNIAASSLGTKSIAAHGQTAAFNIVYQLEPPNPPTINSLDNSICRKVTINWTDNSLNEAGFHVWRATSSSGPWTNISGNLPASAGSGNVRSYTDPTTGQPGSAPVANTTYYYGVTAYVTSPSFSESAITASSPVLALQCTPNINNSSKRIYQINGTNYNSGDQVKNGDILTFQFAIINSNAATDSARISGISPDTLSDNLSAPTSCSYGGTGTWCLRVDRDGDGVFNESGEGGTVSGTAPNLTINVSGDIAPAHNWVIRFDAVAGVSGDSNPLFRNVGTINCIGASDSVPCTINRGVSYLNTSGPAKSPEFREVTP